jgi:hypothetical protein
MLPPPVVTAALGAGAIMVCACVAASIRRLFFALAPVSLDLQALLSAVRGDAGHSRARGLAAALAERTDTEWERDVFQAAQFSGEQGVALLNEQLQELEWRVQRWGRVPRVCASIATSFAFLLGIIVLREGLLEASDLPAYIPPELREAAIRAAVTYAIDVAALGLAGATFCIATQYRAAKAAKEQVVHAERLVERLEVLLGPAPLATNTTHESTARTSPIPAPS